MNGKPPTVRPYEQACFLVLCEDRADAGDLRHRHLDGHLAHVERYWQRYLVAGPLRAEDGGPITGSLFLVFADSEAAARDLMAGDPYVASGLYARMDVKRHTPGIGLALGGKIWDSADALRPRARG